MYPITSQFVELKVERVTKGNVATEKNPINHEKERTIMKLEEVVNFLKQTQISNEECFVNIKQPLDDLLSSLKYLPFDKHFDNLPTEIKTNILSYCDMCDNEAFVAASVCQDWSDILKARVESLEEVSIGEYCSNRDQCNNQVCSDPVEMLKASTFYKQNVHLSIWPISTHITEIDPNLITEALAGVSNISIAEPYELYEQVMTPQQLQHLFLGLQNKKEIMDSVAFTGVNLADLDQDELVNYFLKKTKKLDLNCELVDYNMVDGEKLIRKLNESMDIKLEHLSLGLLKFPVELTADLADGLCKIKTLDLKEDFRINPVIMNRLIENILTRTITMKSFHMEHYMDWKSNINTDDFKNLIEKLEDVTLRGAFSIEQVEVVNSIPGVEVTVEAFRLQEDHCVISKRSI